jgi:hypothetical protein
MHSAAVFALPGGKRTGRDREKCAARAGRKDSIGVRFQNVMVVGEKGIRVGLERYEKKK